MLMIIVALIFQLSPKEWDDLGHVQMRGGPQYSLYIMTDLGHHVGELSHDLKSENKIRKSVSQD